MSGAFAVINHLGMADFRVRAGDGEKRFLLEIISSKLDYDREFRRITEDIADFCQQLLLSWDGPTSLRFASDPGESARISLERFLFVRGCNAPPWFGQVR